MEGDSFNYKGLKCVLRTHGVDQGELQKMRKGAHFRDVKALANVATLSRSGGEYMLVRLEELPLEVAEALADAMLWYFKTYEGYGMGKA